MGRTRIAPSRGNTNEGPIWLSSNYWTTICGSKLGSHFTWSVNCLSRMLVPDVALSVLVYSPCTFRSYSSISMKRIKSFSAC